MTVRIDVSSLKETRFYEYALRFLFGGLCTAVAGLIAKYYGPAVGGLFLAFPAIFPAAASLIQSHEKRRKAEVGKNGAARGKDAAALDAFGAALGCLGLISFAIFLWKAIELWPAVVVLSLAFALWSAVSFVAYWSRKHWPKSPRTPKES